MSKYENKKTMFLLILSASVEKKIFVHTSRKYADLFISDPFKCNPSNICYLVSLSAAIEKT